MPGVWYFEGVPGENRENSLESFGVKRQSDADLKNFAEQLVLEITKPTMFSMTIIAGPPGCGKTHISIGIAQKVRELGDDVGFINKNSSIPDDYFLDKAIGIKLLVIDDFVFCNPGYTDVNSRKAGDFLSRLSTFKTRGIHLLLTSNVTSEELDSFRTNSEWRPFLGEACIRFFEGDSQRCGLADFVKRGGQNVLAAMRDSNIVHAGIVLGEQKIGLFGDHSLPGIFPDEINDWYRAKTSPKRFLELYYHKIAQEDWVSIIETIWEYGKILIIYNNPDMPSLMNKIQSGCTPSKWWGLSSRLASMLILKEQITTVTAVSTTATAFSPPNFFDATTRSYRPEGSCGLEKIKLTGPFALSTDGHGNINASRVLRSLFCSKKLSILVTQAKIIDYYQPFLLSLVSGIEAARMDPKAYVEEYKLPKINYVSGLTKYSFADLSQDISSFHIIEMNAFKIEILKYGRTFLLQFKRLEGKSKSYYGIAVKTQKKDEPFEALIRELRIQQNLLKDENIRSGIPRPIGYNEDAEKFVDYGGWHPPKPQGCIAFAAPNGYYQYLSEIEDQAMFSNAACNAAFDLGYLFCNYHLVFPNLISTLHGDRSYTLLPDFLGASNLSYGGLPGTMAGVIGEILYENIGGSGLRDLGDLVDIDAYIFTGPDGKPRNLSQAHKTAHFVSLYLMIFTVLIGNRSRMLEARGINTWHVNDILYSQVLASLFEGLGIQLSLEEKAYIDPSLIRSTTVKTQPGEKFNRQMYFCFTKNKGYILPQDEYVVSSREGFSSCTIPQDWKYENKTEFQKHQKTLAYYFGTSKALFYDEEGRPDTAFAYLRKADFGHQGNLGSFSGINPLVMASKSVIRAGQLAVARLCIPDSRQGA